MSLADRITAAESQLQRWETLSEQARTARGQADTLCNSDDSLLMRFTDAELAPMREAARDALALADEASRTLAAFESEHGGERDIAGRLDGLRRERQEQDKREFRKLVRDKLGEQLKLLDALHRAQKDLNDIRHNARSQVGANWVDTLPAGLPYGMFPAPGIGLSGSLLNGFKYMVGRYDSSLLEPGDPVLAYLDREGYQSSLRFICWH